MLPILAKYRAAKSPGFITIKPEIHPIRKREQTTSAWLFPLYVYLRSVIKLKAESLLASLTVGHVYGQ